MKKTPQHLADHFARNLRTARQKRKVSQSQLAERAKLSVSYISMLEGGRRSPPLDTIEALAGALSVEPISLLSAAAA